MSSPACKPFSFWSRPKALLLKATPVLTGLRSEDHREFAWARVRPNRGSDGLVWDSLDERGQVLREADRPIRLQLPSRHLRNVALRAHARGLRQDWQRGCFLMQAEGVPRRGDVTGALVISTLMTIGVAVSIAKLLLETYPCLDRGQLFRDALCLLISASAFLAVGLLPGVLVVLLFARDFRDAHLRRIRIDNAGIEAEMDYGAVMQATWPRIQDLTVSSPCFVALQLRDGQVIRLGPLPPQVIRALRAIRPLAIAPASLQAGRQRARRRKYLLACFVLAASLGAAVLDYTLLPGAPGQVWSPLISIGVVAGSMTALVLIPAALAGTRLEKQLRSFAGRRRRLRGARERTRRSRPAPPRQD